MSVPCVRCDEILKPAQIRAHMAEHHLNDPHTPMPPGTVVRWVKVPEGQPDANLMVHRPTQVEWDEGLDVYGSAVDSHRVVWSVGGRRWAALDELRVVTP